MKRDDASLASKEKESPTRNSVHSVKMWVKEGKMLPTPLSYSVKDRTGARGWTMCQIGNARATRVKRGDPFGFLAELRPGRVACYEKAGRTVVCANALF